MNYRRGAIRLIIVWFIFWAGWTWFWDWQLKVALQMSGDMKGRTPDQAYWAELTYIMQQAEKAGDMFNIGLAMLIVVPFVTAVVGATAYWVYRGFKPKQDTSEVKS